MNHFLVGVALGGIGTIVAMALGIAPPLALLIGSGIAAVVWLRLYRLDIAWQAILGIFD